MHGIIHWYNVNRKTIWKVVGIIIVFIIIIQLFRYIWKQNQEAQLDIGETQNTNSIGKNLDSVTLEGEESTISGEKITEGQTALLRTLDEFMLYCNEKKIDEAYQLLSEDCKKEMYPTLENFQENYYNKIFNGKYKNISVENWIGNTYKVKILDDALSTGIYNTENTIQDYVTIVEDNEEIKLNINNYIGKQELNSWREVRDIKVNVVERHRYMDYETYVFEITNNSNNTILMNDINNLDTIYLEDSNDIKYLAYTHELSEAELKVTSGETRRIAIKYYNKYSTSKTIKSITFSRVILNYSAYANYQNLGYYNDYGTIQVSI